MKKRDRQPEEERQVVTDTRQLIALFKKEFGEDDWKRYFDQVVKVELTGA